MDEFLSTRQVIDILKVDRITIYRMLQDGRLKGIKIGQQWRFPINEVERLLGAEPVLSQANQPDPSTSFPVHCVQTIQDLYSDISGISAVMVDSEGIPLTEITHPCTFCQLILKSPEGKQACLASWRSFAECSDQNTCDHTCHAGLQYVSTQVTDGNIPVGLFLSGQFTHHPAELIGQVDQLHSLSSKYAIPEEDLQKAAQQIPVIPPEREAQIQGWSMTVARSVQSILCERTGFLSRLQQIASLTQIS